MYKYGFIGCGNMGGALALGVSRVEKSIAVSGKTKSHTGIISEKTGAAILTNAEIAECAEYIVLGVKPHMLSDIFGETGDILRERFDRGEHFVIISMLAGVSIEKITDTVGRSVPVIRIMPNTPTEVGCGMTVYCVNETVCEADEREFLRAFSETGELMKLDEKLIDAASAVSGCGPAFVYMFIEALADGGVKCGLPRALAMKLAAKTVSGAGDMVLLTGRHPGELKDAVCSPGGSTIEGVITLEKEGLRPAVSDAVSASFEKTKKLG